MAKTKKSARRPARATAKPASEPARAKKATPRLRQPSPAAASTGPYLGQIALLPFGFGPQGWAPCNGQILSISQNVALFQLIRTTYGGNGTSMFMLPNLPPRGPGGPSYYIAIEGVVPS